jgi:hypothetical protein
MTELCGWLRLVTSNDSVIAAKGTMTSITKSVKLLEGPQLLRLLLST